MCDGDLVRGILSGFLVGIHTILSGLEHLVVIVVLCHPFLHGHSVQLFVAMWSAWFLCGARGSVCYGAIGAPVPLRLAL